jgi:hypothetical protein
MRATLFATGKAVQRSVPLAHSDPYRTIAEIRRLLSGLLEGRVQTGPTIGRALRLVEDLEAAVRHAGGAGRAGGPRAPVVVTGYTVESGKRGDRSPALLEHRSSGAQPFRCPRPVYDAIAEELAGDSSPMAFKDLHKRVNKRLSQPTPIYQIRMCLRCWIDKGLALHGATRFSPVDSASFMSKSKALWDVMARAGPRESS